MDSAIVRQFGNIGPNGILKIFDKETLISQLKSNSRKNVELVIYERQNPITHPMRSYYKAVVVPEMQRAFFYTGLELSLDEIDNAMRMKGLYKETYSDEKDRYVRERLSLSDASGDVSTKMMLHYILFCIRYSAQNLNWAIPYPHEELKRNDLTDNQIKDLLKK